MFITHLHADHIADYYNYFLLGGNVTNDEGDNLAGRWLSTARDRPERSRRRSSHQ